MTWRSSWPCQPRNTWLRGISTVLTSLLVRILSRLKPMKLIPILSSHCVQCVVGHQPGCPSLELRLLQLRANELEQLPPAGSADPSRREPPTQAGRPSTPNRDTLICFKLSPDDAGRNRAETSHRTQMNRVPSPRPYRLAGSSVERLELLTSALTKAPAGTVVPCLTSVTVYLCPGRAAFGRDPRVSRVAGGRRRGLQVRESDISEAGILPQGYGLIRTSVLVIIALQLPLFKLGSIAPQPRVSQMRTPCFFSLCTKKGCNCQAIECFRAADVLVCQANTLICLPFEDFHHIKPAPPILSWRF